MNHQPVVSVVVPTFERLRWLKRSLEAIASGTRAEHEIVVVDGGSRDGTREWLLDAVAEQELRGEPFRPGSRLRVVLERERRGAVVAFNAGFRAAEAPWVAWMNDDAAPMMGAIDAALDTARAEPDKRVLVAMLHDWSRSRNVVETVVHQGRVFRRYHVRGFPYANFGLIARDYLALLGGFDEGYYLYGADPDLALRVWASGGRVVGSSQALVAHVELRDARRAADARRGTTDNDRLFTRWDLPDWDGDERYPAPPTVRPRRRGLAAATQVSPC